MDEVENILVSKFKLSRHTAYFLLVDLISEDSMELTYVQYDDIMRQMVAIGQNILPTRIKAFEESFREDDSGIVECLDLHLNAYNVMQILNMSPDLYILKFNINNIKLYDSHENGYLNFLQFNNFITDIVNGTI